MQSLLERVPGSYIKVGYLTVLKKLLFLLFCSVLGVGSARVAFAELNAGDVMLRMNRAAAELSYEGVFVAVSRKGIEAIQLAHQVKDMMMKERLYALSGVPREIVRDEDRVWCFIPDQKTGVHEYRQASESGFPRILPGDLSALAATYSIDMGAKDRIAGRETQRVGIRPLDGYRYGYDLWADQETGLLLRSDLLDEEQQIVEQYMFVEIRIGEVPDEKLEAVSPKQDLEWFGNDDDSQWAIEEQSSAWRIERLPPGFAQSRHIFRVSPMNSRPMEHFVFTDGLATVSAFIKSASEAKSSMSGLSSMGSVHAFSLQVDGFQVTVMGEVPAKTVEFIANAIVHDPSA